MADRERGIKYKSEKTLCFWNRALAHNPAWLVAKIRPSKHFPKAKHIVQNWKLQDSVVLLTRLKFVNCDSLFFVSSMVLEILMRLSLQCYFLAGKNLGRRNHDSSSVSYPLISHFYTDFSRHVLRAFLRLMCHWYIYAHMWIWCVCVLFMWPQDWPCPNVQYFWCLKSVKNILHLFQNSKVSSWSIKRWKSSNFSCYESSLLSTRIMAKISI